MSLLPPRKPKEEKTREEATAVRAQGTEEVHKQERPNRIPVGLPQNLLTVSGLDTQNFEYRWVLNEYKYEKNRVARFIQGGWEHVTDANVKVGDGGVDTTTQEGGVSIRTMQGKMYYLMRIRKEWYDEDQQLKAKEIEAGERQLYKDMMEKEGYYGELNISA